MTKCRFDPGLQLSAAAEDAGAVRCGIEIPVGRHGEGGDVYVRQSGRDFYPGGAVVDGFENPDIARPAPVSGKNMAGRVDGKGMNDSALQTPVGPGLAVIVGKKDPLVIGARENQAAGFSEQGKDASIQQPLVGPTPAVVRGAKNALVCRDEEMAVGSDDDVHDVFIGQACIDEGPAGAVVGRPVDPGIQDAGEDMSSGIDRQTPDIKSRQAGVDRYPTRAMSSGPEDAVFHGADKDMARAVDGDAINLFIGQALGLPMRSLVRRAEHAAAVPGIGGPRKEEAARIDGQGIDVRPDQAIIGLVPLDYGCFRTVEALAPARPGEHVTAIIGSDAFDPQVVQADADLSPGDSPVDGPIDARPECTGEDMAGRSDRQ